MSSGQVSNARIRLFKECLEVYFSPRIAGAVGRFQTRRRGRSLCNFGRRGEGGRRVEGGRWRRKIIAGSDNMRWVQV